MPDPARRGPDGRFGIGVVAHARPDARTAVEHLHALIEEEPEPAQRVGPEIADKDAAVPRKVFRMRVHDESRLRPGFPIVVAGGQNEKRLGAVAARDPAGPEPALGRALDADRHAVVELVVVVLRQWRRVGRGRDEREIRHAA